MGVIVVNTKAYEEGVGDRAVELAKIMEKVGKEYDVEMIIAVQPCDIYRVANETKIKVFCQHIDAIKYGSHTGWILPHAIKEAGARGTLINHSEHRMKIEDIFSASRIASQIGLERIICASVVEIASAVACFMPEYVAIEPPELIGGDISVTKAKPEVVSRAVEAVKKVNEKVKVLCGAGIKDGKDVAKAIELGTEGILVASGVVKAKDKEKVLVEMAEAMVR
ncbi:MAG: triose-phosphate isomerase [Thermoplasmata archaeon]|nr:MAG: triose-phosphate isomerase [Thermoplasmata archaeon]